MPLGDIEPCRPLPPLRTEDKRQDWDSYFLDVAKVVSSRATCPRASVGAVIVKDHRVLATGYNGAPAGEPHCTEVGCQLEGRHCQRAIHAETNAIAQAARFGIAVEGATLYYWDSLGRPIDSCIKCSQLIEAAGIARVVPSFSVPDYNRWSMGTTIGGAV